MFVVALITIFTAEVAIMLAIHTWFPHIHPVTEALADGTLLVLLVFPILFLAIFRPMNETIESLERQRKTLDTFKKAIEHTSQSVVITDRDGQIEYVNPAVEEMTGYTWEDAVGENPRLWKSEEHEPVFYERLWEVILSGETFKAEMINTKKNGENFVIHQTISPMFGEDGEITRFVAIYDDVTAQKERERQLRTEKRHVDRLQQRLAVLNRVLRHDIRTAVTVIQSNLELFQRDGDETALEEIEHKVSELHGISEEAREIEQALSRAESTECIDVSSILRQQIAEVETTSSPVVVEADLPETMFVEASTQLDLALRHVLENAVEHNDSERPELSVLVESVEDKIRIEIADNGPGIPDSELEPLGRETETQLEHTSGLGLWQTLWIVDDSNGTVTFEENDPRGTVVTICLPSVPSDESAS